jgi:hypothetical protein
MQQMPFLRTFEKRWHFVLVLIAALVAGLIIGGFIREIAGPMSALKDFQPLAAASLALTGALIAAIVAFTKTISDEEARREAAEAVEEALMQRTFRTVINIVRDADRVLSHPAEWVREIGANEDFRARLRRRIERGFKSLDGMYSDVAKIPAAKVKRVVQTLDHAGRILDDGTRLETLLGRYPREGHPREAAYLVELDECCIDIVNRTMKMPGEWQTHKPLREAGLARWNPADHARSKGGARTFT